ncbi:MAG: hypothetical protein R3F59_07650 [Myxococcota bacterium]
MEEWLGLRLTGKQYREPAATLHEAESDSGLKHTIVAFDAAYRGHPAISSGVELIASFLSYPMVVGLVEMSHRDPAEGRFAYPTGPFWTLHELLRIHADLSRQIGLRAGLELAWLVGQILVEAAENGAVQGCFSHGGLTPWRIGLRTEGEVIVLGHGLPQVDVLCHQADPSFAVSPDSLRYAPPERLAGQPEDVAADTAALTLIAYEAITGQPLYVGHEVEHLSRAVSMAEGASILSRPNELPRDVAKMFAQSLIFDPDARLSGQAWVDAVGELHARHTDGEPLAAVAERASSVRPQGTRRAARLVPTETAQFTPEQLQQTLEELDGSDPETGEQPKVETRWSRPSRRRGDATVSTDATATQEVTRSRRRRRRREDGETEAPSTSAATSTLTESRDDDGEDSDVSGATERPRRRDEGTDAPPGRRRRRREG